MDVPDLSVIRLEQTLFVGFCSTKCQDLFSGFLTVRPRPVEVNCGSKLGSGLKGVLHQIILWQVIGVRSQYLTFL
jgi:hypothetical protein